MEQHPKSKYHVESVVITLRQDTWNHGGTILIYDETLNFDVKSNQEITLGRIYTK